MRQETNNKKTGALAVLLLFAVFAVCILSVLFTGADAYRRLVQRDQESYSRRTAAQYLTARMHQNDRQGGVRVRPFGDGDALVFAEQIDGVEYETLVYCYGGHLRENAPVVITGRLSLRDDKEPQIVINRARPISDFAKEQQPQSVRQETPKVLTGTLYLRLPGEEGKLYPKIMAILNMFPGESPAVLYFADTAKRRGTRCVLDNRMIEELKNVLGQGNVVLK